MIGNPVRSVAAVRVLDERHFQETGGLNSAFGMAKIQNGDYKFVFEGEANLVEGEMFTSATGQTLMIVYCEPIAPADVIVIWNAWARAA